MLRNVRFRKASAVLATAALASGGGLLATVGTATAAGTPAVSGVALAPSGAVASPVPRGGTGTVPQLTFSFSSATAAPNDVFSIDISPNGTTANGLTPANDVVFGADSPTTAPATSIAAANAALPTGTVSAAPSGQTAPTFALSFSQNPLDAQNAAVGPDQLNLRIVSPGTGGSTYTVTIGGTTTPTGSTGLDGMTVATTQTPLSVSAGPNAALGATVSSGLYGQGTTFTPVTVPSLATVTSGLVTANNPAVAIPTTGATNLPLSNIVLQEPSVGYLHAGTVTVNLTTGTTAGSATQVPVSPTSTPTVTVTSGTGEGNTTPTVVNGNIQFTITAASTTAPATYTISGIVVNAPPMNAGAIVNGFLTDSRGFGAITNTTPATIGPFQVASYIVQAAAIAGADADATAVAAFEHTFPVTTPPGPSCPANGSAVLATDANYPDALAASFLAGYYKTGTLLTNPSQLEQITVTTLQNEGISTVYLVGGPLAVSNSVVTTLENTPVYQCGGQPLAATNAKNINVVRVYGQTADGTAQAVAEYPTPLTTNLTNLTGAFQHASNYNDTTGAESTAGPGVAANTAIVTSDAGFQDAVSASSLGYHNTIPILLTNPTTLSPETSSALTSLGIKQVILLGGPLAVTDSVEAAISGTSGLAIPVLRVAGQDATDTSQLLASLETANLGFSQGPANIARGDAYPDALVAANVTGPGNQTLELTDNSSTLGQYLTKYLNTIGAAGVTTVQPFGGPLALAPSTIQAAANALAQG